MYNLNRFSLKQVGLVGTIFGSLLIGSSAITQSAVAQPRISQINPCPSIFYEEPHRNRVMVPAGCPPNAASKSKLLWSSTRLTQMEILK